MRGRGTWMGRVGATDPACLALVLDCLLCVRHGPLHVVYCMFHVILDPVNHLPLQGQGHPSSRGPASGSGGSLGRTLGKHPEIRERKGGVRRMGYSFSSMPFRPGTLGSSRLSPQSSYPERTNHAVSARDMGTMQRMLSWDPNPGTRCWTKEGRGRSGWAGVWPQLTK